MCESNMGKALTRKCNVFKLVCCDLSVFPDSLHGKLSYILLLTKERILEKAIYIF